MGFMRDKEPSTQCVARYGLGLTGIEQTPGGYGRKPAPVSIPFCFFHVFNATHEFRVTSTSLLRAQRSHWHCSGWCCCLARTSTSIDLFSQLVNWSKKMLGTRIIIL